MGEVSEDRETDPGNGLVPLHRQLDLQTIRQEVVLQHLRFPAEVGTNHDPGVDVATEERESWEQLLQCVVPRILYQSCRIQSSQRREGENPHVHPDQVDVPQVESLKLTQAGEVSQSGLSQCWRSVVHIPFTETQNAEALLERFLFSDRLEAGVRDQSAAEVQFRQTGETREYAEPLIAHEVLIDRQGLQVR